jgi:serine/threonine protein kinase
VSARTDKLGAPETSAISGIREQAREPGGEAAPSRPGALRVGRYIVEDRIAAGGMATVHIGRLRGAAGFSRTVAIKRLLPQLACNPEFESLFVHEARLVARIQHPNVVATLDVVAEAGELVLVMEYVHGETLSRLMQAVAARSERVPQRIVLAIIRDALYGLHAAHEARDRHGAPLDIVHRDISPQNLMVGADGVTRVLDFGIAKAATSVELTREGVVRGKAAYMAPEQLLASEVTRRGAVGDLGRGAPVSRRYAARVGGRHGPHPEPPREGRADRPRAGRDGDAGPGIGAASAV